MGFAAWEGLRAFMLVLSDVQSRSRWEVVRRQHSSQQVVDTPSMLSAGSIHGWSSRIAVWCAVQRSTHCPCTSAFTSINGYAGYLACLFLISDCIVANYLHICVHCLLLNLLCVLFKCHSNIGLYMYSLSDFCVNYTIIENYNICVNRAYWKLPYLFSGVDRLLHLPSAEAVSARPNARPRM